MTGLYQLTKTQTDALAALARLGGHGELDYYGRVCADAGPPLGFNTTTWLRLVLSGHIDAVGPDRMAITELGRDRVAHLFARSTTEDSPE